MPYVGNKPEVGNFRKCDAITTSATATYNRLVGGVAVNPNQNQCIVSLNGVIQSSGNSYTIASSQITFASALTSSDVIDFILILGDTLDVGVPSDDTVDASKITANVITGQTALGATPADTDELLVSDAGVLKRVDYSHIKGGDNTPSFSVYLSGDQSIGNSSWTKFTFDTEYWDTDSAFASNKFTVPSGEGGHYFFGYTARVQNIDSGESVSIKLYKNGSPTDGERSLGQNYSAESNQGISVSGFYIDNANASDYFEVYVYHNEGSSQNAEASGTVFFGYKLIGV